MNHIYSGRSNIASFTQIPNANVSGSSLRERSGVLFDDKLSSSVKVAIPATTTNQIDTGSMSNADEHVVSINPNDVGLRYEVYRKPEVPESIAILEEQDTAKYWEAYDKWEAENFTQPLSWERLLTHELMHSAYGTTNFIVNDHHKIIRKTNEIMSNHYNEVDRHPYLGDEF